MATELLQEAQGQRLIDQIVLGQQHAWSVGNPRRTELA
jgi:hypothetical protein